MKLLIVLIIIGFVLVVPVSKAEDIVTSSEKSGNSPEAMVLLEDNNNTDTSNPTEIVREINRDILLNERADSLAASSFDTNDSNNGGPYRE